MALVAVSYSLSKVKLVLVKSEYRAWKTKFQKIEIITRMKSVSVPHGEKMRSLKLSYIVIDLFTSIRRVAFTAWHCKYHRNQPIDYLGANHLIFGGREGRGGVV